MYGVFAPIALLSPTPAEVNEVVIGGRQIELERHGAQHPQRLFADVLDLDVFHEHVLIGKQRKVEPQQRVVRAVAQREFERLRALSVRVRKPFQCGQSRVDPVTFIAEIRLERAVRAAQDHGRAALIPYPVGRNFKRSGVRLELVRVPELDSARHVVVRRSGLPRASHAVDIAVLGARRAEIHRLRIPRVVHVNRVREPAVVEDEKSLPFVVSNQFHIFSLCGSAAVF